MILGILVFLAWRVTYPRRDGSGGVGNEGARVMPSETSSLQPSLEKSIHPAPGPNYEVGSLPCGFHEVVRFDEPINSVLTHPRSLDHRRNTFCFYLLSMLWQVLNGAEVVWQLPQASAKGVLFVAHGCRYKGVNVKV